MNCRKIARSVSAVAIAAFATVSWAADMPSQNELDMQREGLQLIRQLEESARDIRYNAGRLNAFSGTMHVSKWTHIHHLDQIKEVVNNGLRPALERLTELQPALPSWKQQAIDQMLTAARTLAADANNAMLAKNNAGPTPPVINPEYKKFIASLYQHAGNLVETSDIAGDYAAARLKAAGSGLKVPRG